MRWLCVCKSFIFSNFSQHFFYFSDSPTVESWTSGKHSEYMNTNHRAQYRVVNDWNTHQIHRNVRWCMNDAINPLCKSSLQFFAVVYDDVGGGNVNNRCNHNQANGRALVDPIQLSL